MATQDYAASVQGAAIRVTRLNAAGALLNGSLDSYTTSAFIRMSFTPEYEDGEEITEKAADGTVCVSYKAPDRLKRVTMELAICEPDPELTALLAGGVLLSRNENTANGTLGVAPTALTVTSATIGTGSCVMLMSSTTGITVGSNITVAGLSPAVGTLNGIQRVTNVVANVSVTFATTATGVVTVTSGTVTKRTDTSVGWAAPLIGDDPAGNGVAIEVWSYAVANGKRASANPYFHWIFPYARLRASGDRVIENGLLANTFEGYGIGNTAFGSGPDGRWEWTEVCDRPYAYARDDYSPSLAHLRGFYTWDNTTGAATAVNALPVADVDLDFNVPGGTDYIATTATDITASDI
jgi:uncharacterized protein YaiE (UPF0345 family)